MSGTINITIADDHPVYREGLRKILSGQGSINIVAESDNGRDALDKARHLKPDVILIDINMPGLDGLEIARIRQRERLPFEIVFLTMHHDETIFNEALDLQVKGYVLKESAATDIVRAIRAVSQGKTFLSPELSDCMMGRMAAAKSLRKSKPALEQLTPAERRVLKLIASDKTTKEIADELDLSPRTIDSHRANICAKLGLSGTHSLLKFAFENRSRL